MPPSHCVNQGDHLINDTPFLYLEHSNPPASILCDRSGISSGRLIVSQLILLRTDAKVKVWVLDG